MSENKKTTTKEKDSGFNIAKVFLYIAGFNIVVRCDLWISLVVLTGGIFYLLQARLLKAVFSHIKKTLSQILVMAKMLVKQWRDLNMQKKEEKAPKSTLVQTSGAQNIFAEFNELDEQEVNSAFTQPQHFKEDCFADIWQNYEELQDNVYPQKTSQEEGKS